MKVNKTIQYKVHVGLSYNTYLAELDLGLQGLDGLGLVVIDGRLLGIERRRKGENEDRFVMQV